MDSLQKGWALGLVEVWPDMMHLSSLGDSASALCVLLAEWEEGTWSWDPDPSEITLAGLGDLGPPVVPGEGCRSERNQVWRGEARQNAFAIPHDKSGRVRGLWPLQGNRRDGSGAEERVWKQRGEPES